MKLGLKKSKNKKSKIEESGRKRPKIKKRSLLILAILALLVIVPASGIINGFLKNDASEGKNTEAAKTEQGKAAESANDIDLGDLENRLASDFIRTLNSDQYAIRYKTTTVYNGQPYEVETTFAVSGDNTAMISSDRATIVRDDMVYMLNHKDKTIISWNVDPAKGSPERIDTEGLTYQGSSEEDGLVSEEYTTASSYLKLYFKEKELVKMVAKINNEDVVMNILEVKREAPESLFEVPSGYTTTNI